MPGIDANFCSPVKNNLLCGLCGLPLRKPVQISSCGHRFCESCLNEAFEPLRGETELRCPADQLEVKHSQVYSDESSGKKIQSLTVFCRYCSQGCKWKGPLRKLKAHLLSCDFSVIKCSNDCGVQLMRSQLAEHVRNLCSNRNVSCATCHQDIPRENYEFRCMQVLILRREENRRTQRKTLSKYRRHQLQLDSHESQARRRVNPKWSPIQVLTLSNRAKLWTAVVKWKRSNSTRHPFSPRWVMLSPGTVLEGGRIAKESTNNKSCKEDACSGVHSG